MSVTYEEHLGRVSSGFIRSGAGLNRKYSVSELEGLCELETIYRSQLPSGMSLSDGKGFNGRYIEELRGLFFREYLEYRKVYEEMSLDEFLKHPLEAKKPVYHVPEDEDDLEDDDVSTFYDPEDRVIEGPVLLTKRFGVDSHGYDIWYSEEKTVTAADFRDMFSGVDSVEDDASSLFDTAPMNPLGQLFSEPFGVDERGYDRWYEETRTPTNQSSGLFGELLSEFFGTSADGYDLWYDPNIPAPKLENDGWDHSSDADRFELGTLLTKPVGVDSHGYDLWVIADSSTVKSESSNALGALLTRSFGVDSRGYDVWFEDKIEVQPSKGTVANTPVNPIVASEGPAKVVTPSPFATEEKTLEAVNKAMDRVSHIGRKFGLFMTR